MHKTASRRLFVIIAVLFVVALLAGLVGSSNIHETFVENDCYGAKKTNDCDSCEKVTKAYTANGWKHHNNSFYQCFAPSSSQLTTKVDNSKCLDVQDNGLLTVASCDKSKNKQQWTYDKTNKTLKYAGDNGKCVNIWNAGKTAGSLVGVYDCQSSNPPNQQWTYTSDWQLTSPHAPGMCLDVVGDVAKNGNYLQLAECKEKAKVDAQTTQRWGWTNDEDDKKTKTR